MRLRKPRKKSILNSFVWKLYFVINNIVYFLFSVALFGLFRIFFYLYSVCLCTWQVRPLAWSRRKSRTWWRWDRWAGRCGTGSNPAAAWTWIPPLGMWSYLYTAQCEYHLQVTVPIHSTVWIQPPGRWSYLNTAQYEYHLQTPEVTYTQHSVSTVWIQPPGTWGYLFTAQCEHSVNTTSKHLKLPTHSTV